MRVGVPKESKDQERRAGMTPAGVRELAARGHAVHVACSPSPNWS